MTHHIEEILPLFKKTLIIKEGRVVASGKTEAIINAQTIEELYGVSLKVIKSNGRYWPIAK